jgi:hypothetical protein
VVCGGTCGEDAVFVDLHLLACPCPVPVPAAVVALHVLTCPCRVPTTSVVAAAVKSVQQLASMLPDKLAQVAPLVLEDTDVEGLLASLLSLKSEQDVEHAAALSTAESAAVQYPLIHKLARTEAYNDLLADYTADWEEEGASPTLATQTDLDVVGPTGTHPRWRCDASTADLRRLRGVRGMVWCSSILADVCATCRGGQGPVQHPGVGGAVHAGCVLCSTLPLWTCIQTRHTHTLWQTLRGVFAPCVVV